MNTKTLKHLVKQVKLKVVQNEMGNKAAGKIQQWWKALSKVLDNQSVNQTSTQSINHLIRQHRKTVHFGAQ